MSLEEMVKDLRSKLRGTKKENKEMQSKNGDLRTRVSALKVNVHSILCVHFSTR